MEIVDKIISESKLKSEGVYTAIGTYSFPEMLKLLQNSSEQTTISIDTLFLAYGEHFFLVRKTMYLDLLTSYKYSIEMLSSVENHIRIEVKKIYLNSKLPVFILEIKGVNSLTMLYKLSRAMYHFGLGLMNKTFDYFSAIATIKLQKLKEDGTEVGFIIQKN